jgi:ribose 5-phosphate isomerase B
MKLAIGADHAGFALKEALKHTLRQMGHDVEDVGTHSADSTDYPDYARAVAEKVRRGEADRGILVCLTGTGMAMAANKVPGIRAALGVTPEWVRLSRAHNDANVLTLSAKFTDPATAAELANVFLHTEFEGGRHQRRLAKIAALERDANGSQQSEVR